MACRLVNCSSQLLRVDLRGGGALQLSPGATSAALPEEQLYDNMFLREWEREGLVTRLPARFAEVATQLASASTSAPLAKDSTERKAPTNPGAAEVSEPDKSEPDNQDKPDKKGKGK